MNIRDHLLDGQAIPALPLTLDAERAWSTKYQRALLHYYCEAGTGGIAVGVHSTQFEIREPQHALYEPLLQLAAETIDQCIQDSGRCIMKIAGVCGPTTQASQEAKLAVQLNYDAALLSLSALKDASEADLIRHAQSIAEIIPIIGFYLQPDIGGRSLSYEFWKEFAQIKNVVAIKMAPFNRYKTWDVVRAVIESGRDDLALYTGNDDNIINDLLTPWEHEGVTRFISGGLLGQFGVWTKAAVELLEDIKKARTGGSISTDWLTKNAALTDANAVIFDAANNFRGCIPGIHEILRRQGLMPNNYCLNPDEVLSPGQAEELDRVSRSYPWLTDDAFIQENLERWLSD